MQTHVELFIVKDCKSGLFTAPGNSNNIAVAIREFTEVVNTADHQFHKYPEDYSLWSIGSFNRNDGTLEGSIPKKICEAKEVKNG